MKKIEIELTDDQAAVIENIAEALRSSCEDVAKAYMFEGIQLLTEEGCDDITATGLEILQTYADKKQTPKSVFSPASETDADPSMVELC